MVLDRKLAVPAAWLARFHAALRRRVWAWRGYASIASPPPAHAVCPSLGEAPAAPPPADGLDVAPEPPAVCEPAWEVVVEPTAAACTVAVIQPPVPCGGYPARIRRSLRGCDVRLGVSVQWLATQAEALGLDDDDIDAIIAARREHRAGVPSMLKAIRHGVCPLALPALYTVRDEATALCKGPTFSLKWIYAFTETFPEAELDREDLADLLLEVHRQVVARVPWVWKYPDDALRMLVRAAESYGSNIIDSCLDMLGPCPEETEILAEEIDQ